MSLPIEDLGGIDFSDVATGAKLEAVRPGTILLREFLEPNELTANALARAIHVPANRVTAILAGSRGITADTALRLGRYFGTTPQFWMNLQSNYDLRQTEAKSGDQIEREIQRRSLTPA